MSKFHDVKVNAVGKSLRVECNCGSKYFSDETKAVAYFDYMTAQGFKAELWLVFHCYDEQGKLEKGEQKLLMSAD